MLRSLQSYLLISASLLPCVVFGFCIDVAGAAEHDPWQTFQQIAFPSHPQTTTMLANGYGLYGVKFHGSLAPDELHFMYYAVTEKGATKCEYRAAQLPDGRLEHWFEMKEIEKPFNFGTHALSQPVDVVSYSPLAERELGYVVQRFRELAAIPRQSGYVFPRDMTPELLHATLTDPAQHLNCYQIGCLMPEIIEEARNAAELDRLMIAQIDTRGSVRTTAGYKPVRGLSQIRAARSGIGSSAHSRLQAFHLRNPSVLPAGRDLGVGFAGSLAGGYVGRQLGGDEYWANVGSNVGGMGTEFAMAASAAKGSCGVRAAMGMRAAGLWATPINAAVEAVDAVGILPQWAGGTGIGNFGWSDELEFRQQTLPAGGMGSYLSSGLNAFTHPIRSTYTLIEGSIETIYLLVW